MKGLQFRFNLSVQADRVLVSRVVSLITSALVAGGVVLLR